MTRKELSMHYQIGYAVVACGYYVGANSMTTDPIKVTCGTCIRSRKYLVVSNGTCEHCGKVLLACARAPEHIGCSSGRGYIHAASRAHACEPQSNGPYGYPRLGGGRPTASAATERTGS